MDAPPPGRDGPEPPASAAGLRSFAVQLRRMNAAFQRTAQEFARSQGLHHTDVAALIAILDGDGKGGALTPGRLRDHLRLTSGAVTACLDRLERAGHVRRVRDAADGRVVHLHYAPLGRSVARESFRPLARSVDATRQEFTEAELRTVLRFLRTLNDHLDEERGSAG
ncbi:MarR family winged helix-turn-helix transcriptional regulator [Streptomyces sp. JJ36]|uniref:MarR family winged helix-turn-helix transcriptional regulator n=1 Tax=Streptomyces sp. JJ36 TaxID=2736645 RepID=UPI001F1808FC|nr:MarR family winged helix-turn-helix transcriptional regulator [Streptomyces sp. JJ36]